MRVLIYLSLLTSSLPALAFTFLHGTNSGGGGLVVVCRNGNQIESVELLDLWEAKKHLNPYLDLTPVYSQAPSEEQIKLGIERIKRSFLLTTVETHGRASDVYISGLLQSVSDAFVYKNNIRPGFFSPVINPLRGVQLNLSRDAFEIAIPAPPCAIEQAVTFDDAGEIAYLNMDLIDLLGPTDQAALILHEAFYKVLRSYSDEGSSIRVRRAVGYAMSGREFRPIENSIPRERIECLSASGRTKIYIHSVEDQLHDRPELFGFTAEMVSGVRMLGYSRPSEFVNASSLHDFYTSWLSPEGNRPFALHERPWHSPADYDMNVSLESSTTQGHRQVYVTLKTSPGKTHEGTKEEVFCKVKN
ncbi:MAG: hypothetical protein HC883_03165 [Bdellovibrionaceae bacterium]|nr:hypothetical protein [Pseudobdellovibrionaceae bacterium]